MYYTVQIRLRTDEEQHQLLLAYEKIYVSALHDLIEKMVKRKKCLCFSAYRYPSSIDKSSQWMLYHMASKMAKSIQEKKKAVYHRSGTWTTSSFKIINDCLFLEYGNDFVCKTGRFLLAINSKQQYQLNNGKKLRLDLIHDENCWYCNILMQAKDT
ncbi:hypothetical protein [[Eubacterium] hominis]|uniref:hypothetical protein n=1 Tax=[Eubacterium] hominis TaxID=2764325 RepID=UPI003A4D73C1